MKKIFKNLNFNKGFTLVESLVAISVFTIAILGTFTAVQQGLATSGFAKDQVVAFYLIQDAMEYVRNIRDENGINSLNSVASGGSAVPWLTGLSNVVTDPCYFGKVCRIDSYVKQAVDCSGSCANINQDSSTGLFGYTVGWPATKFKREIRFQQISSNEIVVIVSVSWTSGVFSKNITVRETLFNMR